LTLRLAARTMPAARLFLMARFLFTIVVCGLIATSAQASNIAPLAFGMTPAQATAALGAPLVLVAGKPGSEVFLAERNAGVPGLYPVSERLFLQFRRGSLTGWKKDWTVTRPFWLF